MDYARRKKLALAIALVADVAQGGLFAGLPAISWIPSDGLDVLVAIALLLLVGFRWRFLAALGVELLPAVQLFPSWTAFVISLPAPKPGALPASRPAHGADAAVRSSSRATSTGTV